MAYKLIIGLVIIVVAFCLLLSRNVFDGTKIIRDYLQLFKMNNGKKNIWLFFACNIVPFLLGGLFTYLNCINDSVIESIMLIITILTSVFLTLVGVIIGLVKDNQESERRADKKQRIMEILIETKSILLCEIFISVIEMLVVFTFAFVSGKLANIICSVLIYSMVIWIFLNLFILLKRVAFLIDEIVG